MSYSSDPVLDAARYEEKRAAEVGDYNRRLDYAHEVIKSAFCVEIRKPDIKHLTVPAVHYYRLASEPHVRYLPVREVIADEMSCGTPLDALMEVLNKSDCPHVAALRKAIADSYAASNADELAEVFE